MMVSSIYTAKKSAVLNDIWKFACVFYPTIAMTVNIILVLLLINNHLDNTIFQKLSIEYTIIPKINFLYNLLLHLIIPLFIFNYYMILYKDKYKKLIKTYKNSYNKKIITAYLLISIFGLIFFLLSIVEIRW